MSRRSKAVPDWPKALQLAPPAPTGLTLIAADPGVPGNVLTSAAPPPLLAFLFARLKDGRFLAAEATVEGLRVTHLLPLCTSHLPDRVARAWETCAYARLQQRREYTPTERQANARDGGRVELEAIAEGHAIAFRANNTRCAALGMECEGVVVTEPRVLVAEVGLLSAWVEAFSWAQRTFLPRRRR